MALSDYEKQVLAELEAEFASDTTKQGASTQRAAEEFAGQSRSEAQSKKTSTRRQFLSPRRIAAGGVIAVMGVIGLLAAVSLGYSTLSIALGMVSFAIVVGGIYYALHSTAAPASGIDASRSARGRSRTGSSSGLKRFMDEQARRWDERER